MVTERTPLLVQNARISGYVSIGKKMASEKSRKRKKELQSGTNKLL